LRATVEQRMSGALLSVSGNGKTVVLRALSDSLPEARYRVLRCAPNDSNCCIIAGNKA
jgi:Mg-chelatase subunit ChlI